MALRIVIVEPRGVGGMIHYAYQLCSAMAEEGADVTLVTSRQYELSSYPHNFSVNRFLNLWRQTDPRLSRPPRNRLDAISRRLFWTVRRGFRAIRLTLEWSKLTNYLIRMHPDIVQFGEIDFAFESFFLHRLSRKGITLAQICHEFEARDGVSWFANLNTRLSGSVYEAFSLIFLHGEANKKQFASLFDIPSQRLHVIPMGNEQLFMKSSGGQMSSLSWMQKYAIESASHVILFFGSIAPSKGVPDLIKAFAMVHAADKNARLVIAGMPSKHADMQALIQLAADLGLSDAIVFDTRYVPVEEVGAWMQIASVVVFPYLSGTQSASIQVAYTFGRPVVATQVGGFGEEVDDGLSGMLVPPGSPEALARAIQRIIEDPQQARKMGDYARRLSETRFAWSSIARQILDVYSNFLKASPRQDP